MTVYWHMFVFNMPAVYYTGMKQVIYSMVSLYGYVVRRLIIIIIISNRSGLMYHDAIAVWCIIIKVYRISCDLCVCRISVY